MTDRIDDPLPREWLPDAVAPAGDADLWEARLRRLMEAAQPRLARLREQPDPWWVLLADWWRPRVGLAAAAAAALLLLLLGRLAPAPAPSLASPALSVVAADGDPAALWIGLGREVDPVLAVIALESETP